MIRDMVRSMQNMTINMTLNNNIDGYKVNQALSKQQVKMLQTFV